MSQAPRPVGLDLEDLETQVVRFGVSDEQVLRDHAVSHVLGAISRSNVAKRLNFFGGTALSRTHLISAQLSEDIDLIATDSRWDVCEIVAQTIETGLLRSHGRIT
jgi:predicted nucleotidyltransferase component of viral defense system